LGITDIEEDEPALSLQLNEQGLLDD